MLILKFEDSSAVVSFKLNSKPVKWSKKVYYPLLEQVEGVSCKTMNITCASTYRISSEMVVIS